MVDGVGTTRYAYKAAGTLGALQPATIDGPFANDTMSYAYDELGGATQAPPRRNRRDAEL